MDCDPSKIEVDYSIIRDPIFTSVRSIGDYVTAMTQGTAEVKTLLADECDVILECKVCQSLFRSLPNFIAHKRVYCTQRYGGYLPTFPVHMTEDETVVLEPTDPEEDAAKLAAGSAKVRPLFESVLDGSFAGSSAAYKVFTDALVKEKALANDRDTTIVTLDSIPGNPNAMFQMVETYQGEKLSDDDITKIKNRKRAPPKNAEDVCSKIVKVDPQPASHSHVKFALRQRKMDNDDENAKPGQDSQSGKSKVFRTGDWRRHCNLKSMTCKLCNIRYASMKTLRFHVQSIHREARRFFPCILCNALFSQMWGVRRHMEKIHHKSHDHWLKVYEAVKQKSVSLPLDQLDEHGRPKNYQRSISKSLATKSKERAVANLKKAAAAKISTKTVTKLQTSSCTSDNENDETRETPQKSKSDAANMRSPSNRIRSQKKKKGDAKKSPVKDKIASPGRILKVRVTPAKNDQEKEETSPGSTASSQSGKKVHRCYNCGQTYDLKGSLNKHLNRGRCFHPGPVSRTPERTVKETPHRREALASVLSPKQLKKVNSLMDRDNIRCLQCKKQFTALILLSRHVIRHLGIVRYKCKFCIYRSFNQGECMKHVRNSHKKNDAHKYVLNIDLDSADTKSDTTSRGLAAEGVKPKCRVTTSSVSKQVNRPKSPAASTSGSETSANTAVPTFNLSAAKRLFANTTSPKTGEEEYKSKEEKLSLSTSLSNNQLRPASITRSNSVSSSCSRNSAADCKLGADRKQPGIDSSNIKDPNSIKYNISTRNSPREFDTKPYKRLDTMAALQTRRGVYQKPKVKPPSSSESDEDGKEEQTEDAAEGRKMRSSDVSKSETAVKKGVKSNPADCAVVETPKKDSGSSQ